STDESTVEDTSSDGLRGVKMFDGLTAWFSSSVSKDRKTSWIKNDGLVTADINKAMFVFSEDAGCEDTSSLYKTEAYLDEHLAIFHPAYIDKCLEEGDTKKVAVGQYFLPPSDLQIEILKERKFIWHTNEDGHTEKRARSKKTAETTVRPSEGHHVLNPSSSNIVPQHPDYIRVNDLQQVQGDIEDFVIGENGCCVFERK
ncbi:hypothetical protein LSAT2_010472, partial [Lamellibrachia satsuma]